MRDADRPSEVRRVHLDSAKLQCLAHPLRSRLLSALRLEGPATSAKLAQRLGTNTGATSYHLRQLADVGLVAEDPDRGTARERWWRAAHDMTSWSDADFEDDPDDRAANEWLLGSIHRQKALWRDDWLVTRNDWPRAWREAATTTDLRLRLTPSQLAAFKDEVWALVERYEQAPPDPAPDDEPTEDVLVLLDAFPAREVRL
ncbi:winged helix-turn-helix domain-containing protein [Euzebya sp.]|uniref:winged helix-turn-helix domain-containing protein n=1 Tax=Euzebya sp. TaxID=1971409 RepID=UPI003515ABB5